MSASTPMPIRPAGFPSNPQSSPSAALAAALAAAHGAPLDPSAPWSSLEFSLLVSESRLARRNRRALAQYEESDEDPRALSTDATTLHRLITSRRDFQKARREHEIFDREKLEEAAQAQDFSQDEEGEDFDDEAPRFQGDSE